jgi:hypothetical protein
MLAKGLGVQCMQRRRLGPVPELVRNFQEIPGLVRPIVAIPYARSSRRAVLGPLLAVEPAGLGIQEVVRQPAPAPARPQLGGDLDVVRSPALVLPDQPGRT